jgi:hypothetical protein
MRMAQLRKSGRTTRASRKIAEEAGIEEFEVGSLKKRAESVREWANAKGLLEGGKDLVIRGRMPKRLVSAAKAKTGIKSDTKLIEVALANLAIGDDYGEWLLSKAGVIPKDIDLEF